MKVLYKRSEGSVIMMVLIMTVVIGVTLGSYLNLVSNQNQSIMRSMAWNHAVAIAEAGIEEAMAHLNYNTTNRVRDGWHLDGNGSNVFKQKVVGDSMYITYLNVNVEPPAIISEGYVENPNDGIYLPNPRVVRVTTTNDALFAKGMVAKGHIDLNGNNIRTDSFDSTNPLYNTDGRYDPAKNRDNGDVATNSKLINVGNAEIFGKASTGPGGIVDLGANGTVGSKAWHANPANAGKVQPGWVSDDMNVQFPDVKDPFVGKMPVPFIPLQVNFAYGGVTYDYVIPGPGDFILNGPLNLNNKKLLVLGDVNFKVMGNISVSGQANITIATNASLNLYMAGPVADFAGQGIINKNGKAGAFSYWGMNSNTQVRMSGNSEFIGTVYAPQAQLDLGGGGNLVYDFMGASVSKTVEMNGHFKFHYDESLGMFGPKRGYTIVTWNEVDPVSM